MIESVLRSHPVPTTHRLDGRYNRSFVNDTQGNALYVNQSPGAGNRLQNPSSGYLGGAVGDSLNPGHVQRQLVVNGEVMARYGDAPDSDNPPPPGETPKYTNTAEFNLDAPALQLRNANFSAMNYTVAGGETLKTIARNVLGDAGLWWRIAQANGLSLSGDGQLQAGQTLSIPKLALNANNADSFQPYDPSRITGSTDPSLPAPAAQGGSGGGCGGLGKVIMVVVAVVVAINAPYLLAQMGGSLFVSGGAVTPLGAAAGAAAGSIASQVAGNAMGVQDGFSWKSVGLSALSAGIANGLNTPALMGGSGWQDTALRMAATNTLTQGIGVATGLQRSFDWRGVAASAAGGAGGAVGSQVADQLKDSSLFSDWSSTAADLARGTLGGLAAGTTAAVARGGRISMQQVATDAFGNALGQSLASVASQVSTAGLNAQEDRLGAFIQENLGAWTQRQANYDQLIDGFSNYTSDRRAEGVQLAAGADYTGGVGSGLSDREANIARMLRWANEPEAMGSTAPQRSFDSAYRMEIVGIGSTGRGDGTRWIPDTGSLGGTVAGKRMTQAEMEEFDRLNAAEMLETRAARYGSLTAYQPSLSERTWLSPSVQYAASNSFTGQLVSGLVNAAGSIAASIRADRYNFATDKYLNPVEQRNARIDNLINLVTLPLGGGALGTRTATITSKNSFYNVTSNGLRGELPLTLEQRLKIDSYLSKFDMDGVTIRWVDDRNLNTAYGDMFGERILNIGSDIVPGNIGAGTLKANSRVSINGTLAHEIVGHMEAGMAGRTQDLLFLEEAQASIRAARFAPDLTSTERFTLLRDAISRLQNAPGGSVRIRDVKESLYIQNR